MSVFRTRAIFSFALVLLVAAIAYNMTQSRTVDPASVSLPLAPVVDANHSAKIGHTLQLQAKLSNSHLAQNTRPESTFLLLDVNAAQKAQAQVPLDVAIVLDQSSSMRGEFLLRAQAAARAMVEKLKPGDRVALVSYETFVRVDVPLMEVSANRAKILDAISKMEALGGTNIEKGLSVGADLLSAAKDAGRIRRMVLLSDGHATVGKRTPGELGRIASEARSNGVSVTSMGLGVDFNELAMTEVARQGGGNYHFIEHSNQLPLIFEKELGDLNASVASQALVEVSLSPGTRLRNVAGFAHTLAGSRVLIPMSEFRAGENKSALLELELELPAGARGEVPVASVRLLYKDLSSQEQENFSASLSMVATNSLDILKANEELDVMVRREQILTAHAYDRAMHLFDKGQEREAQAIISTRNSALKKANSVWKQPLLREETGNMDRVYQSLGRASSLPGKKALIKSNRARSYRLQTKSK